MLLNEMRGKDTQPPYKMITTRIEMMRREENWGCWEGERDEEDCCILHTVLTNMTVILLTEREVLSLLAHENYIMSMSIKSKSPYAILP